MSFIRSHASTFRKFNWRDPLDLESQLSQDERAIQVNLGWQYWYIALIPCVVMEASHVPGETYDVNQSALQRTSARNEEKLQFFNFVSKPLAGVRPGVFT